MRPMKPQDILKPWLDAKGWGSQKRLAEDSGLSESYISDLANGNCGQRLTADTARALEKGTGIKATVWLGLEPPRKRKQGEAAA